MSIYFATFSAVAVTAAQDVFSILAPATSRVVLREVRLGQYSDLGDAAAEMLGVQITRGYTTAGSVGAAVTPVLQYANAVAGPTAGSTIRRNDTTQASVGTAQVMISEAFNIMAGWLYRPPADERIELEISTRLVIEITAPADELTMSGTMVFEEIGHPTISG
jgi:hypothetical protein